MEESKFLLNPGDSLIIETRQNNSGEYNITNPEFEFGGVISEDAYVDIYFRTLSNGVILSDWEKIGTQNSALKQHSCEYNIGKEQILQIKFERSNDSVEGEIEFVRFFTEGDYILIGKETPTLDASMFAGVNSDPSTVALENNLFKKLYFRGILPNYIKRGDNRSMNEDRDFVTLFSTVARFFALIIKFFKRWENIVDDEEMLKEILRNHGIQFNESEITLKDLKTLVANIYNEFSKRGTREMFLLAGDNRPDGTTVDKDGEFMRMIRAKAYTELLMENVPNTEIGWCLGVSSPMYRGISNKCYDLDKLGVSKMLFDDVTEFKSKFLWFGNVALGTNRSAYGDGYTIMWNTGGTGIGRTSVNTDADDFMIPVDACMDYEIVIGIRVNQINENGKIYAYVEGFNNDKVKLQDSFITPDKSNVVMHSNPDGEDIICGNFFNSETEKYCPTTYFKTTNDYFIRFIIKAYSTEPQSKYALNIGIGNELHFNNSFVRYILPTIMVDSCALEVFDIHMRPLVRGTNINPIIGEGVEDSFSLGFLQTSNFFHMYLRNRNTTMSEQDVEDFINRNMLPYSGANIITFIK